MEAGHAAQPRPHRDQPCRQPAAPGRADRGEPGAPGRRRRRRGAVPGRNCNAAVVDVVRRQQELGIDIPGDGEFGKAMGHRVNYGAWWSYSFQRLGGLDPTGPGAVRHAGAPFAARRGGADQLRRPARPAALRRGLCRSGIRHHHGAARPDVAGLHRPDHLHRSRRDRARHRQLQGGRSTRAVSRKAS